MPVPTVYLSKASGASAILTALQKAGIPDRFTHDFLRKQLGFTSSADRPIIPVLKALRFIDESGAPLDRYKRFRDQGEAGGVMAEALRDTYSDVFAADQNAQTLGTAQLQGIFARISGRGEAVAKKMASTFKALADVADWNTAPAAAHDSDQDETNTGDLAGGSDLRSEGAGLSGAVILRHDIHIHLPESTEIAVYDAIFRSIRSNLQD